MAVRARADNLALDHPADEADTSTAEFQALWEHRDDVRAACRHLVGEDGTADDVVQETFLRWLTNAKRLDRRMSFAPWLATVARRRSIDELRTEARVRLVAVPPERAGTPSEDPLEQVLQQERFHRVRAALAELSVRERQLLLRQTAHGLSLAELAAEEATSIASVRSVLARARTKLRASLERGGPLGAAPAPGVVAAVKRRLHRWAARLEGSTPMLAGTGAQFGDVVMAAIAALALLLSGTPGPGAVTDVLAISAEGPPDSSASSSRAGDRHTSSPASAASDEAISKSDTKQKEEKEVPPPPPGGWLPPGVDLPGFSDGAQQPDDAHAMTVAASDDGRTVIVTGPTSAEHRSDAGGRVAMYRSDDGGHTWRRLRAGGYTAGRIMVPPGFAGHGTMFVVTDTTLLRSIDGGDNFEPMSASRGVAVPSPRYATDRQVFVAPAGLAVYDDSVLATIPLTAAPTSTSPLLGGLALSPEHPSDPTILVGVTMPMGNKTSQALVQRCTPTKCDVPVALPDGRFAPRLLRSVSVPGLTVAWTADRLYRSLDGGITFTALPVPAGVDILQVADGRKGELLLARSNTGRSTDSGLLRSGDGGLTWAPLGVDTPLQQGARSVVHLGGGRIVAGLSPGAGLLCSWDNGVSWAPRCPA